MCNVILKRVSELLLPWRSNKYYVFCGYVRVCMLVRACSLAYPPCNSDASYCDVICGRSGSIIFFDIIS
jgi:hypothetical protein